MLQVIGLGLADETDITVKGLELVKKAERVYLEAYTSILLVDTARLVSICNPCKKFPKIDQLLCSRKPTMVGLSSLRTVKWSSHKVTRF